MLQSHRMATTSCLFRPMDEADIPQVYAIDHEAFPAESLFRPYSSYSRELHNAMAHYIVGCVPSARRERKRHQPWFKRLVPPALASSSGHNQYDELLVGFAGFWVLFDEAHIIAIAVREPYRRQGIGQGLLISAIVMAAKLRTRVVTLEVRESNTAAQEMYLKHGFKAVGKRPRYYSDNQEDAVLMSIDNLDSDEERERLRQLKAETLRNGYLSRLIEVPDEIYATTL